MGTNYYRVNLPTEEDYKKMHQLIDERRIKSQKTGWHDEDIPDALEDIIDKCTEEVHICKMSMGWQTCFDHNWGKYYLPNRKSLEKFLSASNTVIKDEYGEIISPEDFWKLVEERDNFIREDGSKPFTSKTYMEWEKVHYPNSYRPYICRDDIKKCKELFSVTTEDNDFEVDGLRFAVYSDFS